MKFLKQVVVIGILVNQIFATPKTLYAQSTTSVNATIKLSVCGNNIKEDPEDCDNSDFGLKSCTSLNYASGTLKCDSSCTLDTTGCVASSNTTSATTSPTSTPVSVQTNITQTLISDIIPLVLTASLPSFLKSFDEDGNQKIKGVELTGALTQWVKSWKQSISTGGLTHGQSCDFNDNDACDLDDFSILLYHSER